MSARVPRRQHVVGAVHSRSDVAQRRSRGIGRRWMHVRTSTSMRAADSSSSRCPTAIITGASGPPAVAHAYTRAHNGRRCCVRLGTLEQHSTARGLWDHSRIRRSFLLVRVLWFSSEYCGGALSAHCITLGTQVRCCRFDGVEARIALRMASVLDQDGSKAGILFRACKVGRLRRYTLHFASCDASVFCTSAQHRRE
jgi:hypothetical protein